MGNTLLTRRVAAVDLTKAAAICAVLLIHCSANRFALFPVSSGPWLCNAFWATVSRWAVPAFLLCSGALMNDPGRDLPLPKLFSRYLLRLALALAVWAGLYELLRIFLGRGTLPLAQLLVQSAKNWLTGSTYYHLYYFYFVLALYLALPLTRLIVRWASPTELKYILALWLAAGVVIPWLGHYPPFSAMGSSLLWYRLPPVFTAVGLGLLGWFLRQHPPRTWFGPLALFLSGFAMSAFGLWRRSAAAGALDTMYLDGFSPFVILMAVGVFQLAQRWTAERQLSPAAALLSRASFCVYLIHPFFQWLTRQNFFEALPPLWGVPLQAAVLLALSLAAYAVLRRIPLVNRWLI